MLVLNVWLEMLLSMSLQRYSLVLETSTFSILHGDLWITTAIDDSHSIPIGVRTVYHEAFEIGLFQAVFSYEFVEFFPYNTLDFCVL
jgi:hypothetical protein